MIALARDVLDDVVDELALVEPVEEARERTEVERRCADAQEVVLDAAELAHDRADDLRARGQLDAEELLDRVVPRDVVHDRRDVVHPADRADILVVVVVLAELLEAGMQVADVRGAARDAFAVELEHEPQGRVGRRVLRTEVQHPPIGGLKVILEVVRVLDIKAEAFAGGNRVRHRAESIRPATPARGSFAQNAPGRRNGFDRRSAPIVVSGPWPGSTLVSSGNCIRTSSERRMASVSLVGKSIRPMEPANSVSPTIASAAESHQSVIPPGECPGVCNTRK